MQMQIYINQSSIEMSQKEKEFIELISEIIVNATLKELDDNNHDGNDLVIQPLTFNL